MGSSRGHIKICTAQIYGMSGAKLQSRRGRFKWRSFQPGNAEVAQLVELFPCKELARGSNPLFSSMEDYTRKCVKCGKKYIPHLIKPLTICDECADKLASDMLAYRYSSA